MKVLPLIIIIILLWNCNTKQCSQNFSFEFPLSVTPKDTFNVGDTIWFEMQSSKEVLDVYSGNYYDITHLVYEFNFSIQKLDTIYIYNAVPDFDFIPVLGQIEMHRSYFNDIYIHFKDKENAFKFGIIPNKLGVFESSMSLSDELYYLETGEYKNNNLAVYPSSCDHFMHEFSSVVTNNGATNRHLRDSNKCYQFSPNDTTTSCIGTGEIPLSGRGTFAFVVR